MKAITKTNHIIFFITFFLINAFSYGQNCNNLNLSFSYNLSNNGCSNPDTISFTNTSTGTALATSTFYWVINNKKFDTTTSNTSPKQLVKGNGTYTIKLIAVTSTNCSDTITQSITITPKPDISINNIADTVCQNSRAYFTSSNTGVLSSTTYNWNFGDGNSTSGTSDSASNQYNSPGNYTVTLTAINQTGCFDVATKTVTVVNGGKKIRFYDDNGNPANAVVWSRCINIISIPDSFSQVFASPDTIFNYTVDFGDGNSISGDTLLPYPTAFLQHTYLQTGVFDFVLTSRNAGGCVDVFYGKIINLRVPTVGVGGPYNGVQSGCVPMTTSFYNSSSNVSGNTTFTWDFGDGTTSIFDTSNVGDSVFHSYYTSLCDVYINLTATNECGSTQSSWGPVNAYTKDDARISGAADLCYPDTTTLLSISSQLNCYSGIRYYQWDFGDGTTTGWSSLPLPQLHAFPDTGTYTVVLFDSNVCGIDSGFLDVNIYLPPEANFWADTVCLGEETTFLDSSTIAAGNGNITTYTWNFGDGHTSSDQNPKHTYNSYGTFSVSLTVQSEHGCFDVFTKNVFVKETPSLSIGTSPSNSLCDSNTVSFTGNISLNTSTITSMLWDFDDGNTTSLQNPTHTFNNNGTYNVKFSASAANGCSSIDSTNIYIYSSPIAKFVSDSICFGDVTQFTDSSTTQDGENIVSWKWDFNSDGNIDNTNQNPSNSFPNYGVYDITLIITTEFGCIDSVTQTSHVHQNPIPSFSVSNNVFCQYDSTRFSNNSTVSDSFSWMFGDGESYFTKSKSDIWHKYDTSGSYYAKLTAYNYHGCSEADSVLVTIKEIPVAGYSKNKSQGCEPLSVQFTNSSSNTTNYFWDFGNGISSTSNDTSITYSAGNYVDTNYTVTLIAEKSGCYDTIESTINVYHKAYANFQIVPDSGCSPLTVYSNNLSQGADSYFWSCTSGDTSSQANPVFSFGNYQFSNIIYDLTLYANTANNCPDTAQTQIKIKPSPFALFTTDKIQGCAPLNINFTNHSIIADSYFWDFGDGTTSTAADPSHTYAGLYKDTTYTIKLWASSNNGCVDSFSKTINVFSKVVAHFNNSDTACIPFSVQFTDQSTNASFWNWSFGDGSSSSSKNPSHSYTTAGIYSVSLAISNQNGCADTLTLNNIIKANATPTANFSITNQAGCEPLKSSYLNQSQLASIYYWEFGDGNISSATNPQHTFITPNQDTTYHTKLIVSTTEGCTDSITKNVTVYKSTTAYFNDSLRDCIPARVSFTDSSSYATNWLWDFGDGNTSTLQNPNYTYQSAGIYDVQLIASNQRCSDTFTLYQNINALAVPTANFNTNNAAGCEPLEINYYNQSQLSNIYYWDFGDGSISNAIDPQHTFYTPNRDTTYQTRLMVSTLDGCLDSITKTINIYKSVTAYFNDTIKECVPANISFTDSSSFATNWLWDFGDGNTSAQQNPSYSYQNPGIYSVELIASNHRCSDTFRMHQNVKALTVPTAYFTTDNIAGCEPLKINYFNQSNLADTFIWKSGDGNIAYTSNISHTFSTPNQDTSYFTKLYAYTNEGCIDSFVKKIDVYKAVEANFNDIDSGCVPFTMNFQDLSSYANFWQWNFGDGNSSGNQNPQHTYQNPGEYDVMLIASNYKCTDTFSIQNSVKTFENPIALFATDQIKGCEPLKVNFTDQSVKATKYYWDFGDQHITKTQSPKHTFYAGFSDTTFISTLYVETNKGCKDSFDREITVYKSVTANFNKADSGCAPLGVNFTDQSDNAFFWLWDFGDGNASTVQSPKYVYHNPGKYSVKLIASNNHCADTFEMKDNITVWEVPISDFKTHQDTVIFPNTTFNFYSLSKQTLYHTWYFGDGSTGTSLNPTYSYKDTGNYFIKLAVATNHCSDTSMKKVRVVPPLPTPDFVFDPHDGCIPLEIKFTDSSEYATSWIWSFGDGSKSNKQNPTHTYTVPGKYSVTLITKNDIGTTNITKTDIIEVYPQPTSYFDVSPNVAFLPNAKIQLINKSIEASTYEWYIDEAFVSYEENPMVTYNYPGHHDVKLVSISDQNCTDTSIKLSIIRIDSQGSVVVPNAFTPTNGDGLNDVFIPKCMAIPKITIGLLFLTVGDKEFLKQIILNKAGMESSKEGIAKWRFIIGW
jgi:PKD repeat protein